MTLQIFTRSCNPELYNLSKKLYPDNIEAIRCPQFTEWWQASEYLHYVINTATEWAINIDEDAFIVDWDMISGLIEEMERTGVIYAGMPDGGVCHHRCRSWVVMNPYFTVFNCKAIREYIEANKHPQWLINSCGLHPDMEAKKPEFVKGIYNHDGYEPFSGLFYWLFTWAKPLYLNAHGHNDGISSILLHHNKPIVYHSWYSREFSNDVTQRNRILSLYEEATGTSKG